MVKMCIQEQWKDRKTKKIISFLIYIILVLSVFSDVLRIPGSAVTFFRLSLPFAVLILAFYPYWFLKYWIIILGLFFLSLLQYILFFSCLLYTSKPEDKKRDEEAYQNLLSLGKASHEKPVMEEQ